MLDAHDDRRTPRRQLAADLDAADLELVLEQREDILDDRVDVDVDALAVVGARARQRSAGR